MGKRQPRWRRIVVRVVFLYVLAGLYFARDDIDFIWSLRKFTGLPYYDQQMYLWGSDYMTYDYLQTNSLPSGKILALVPDPYFYRKLTFFLYPREIRTIGRPEALANELKAKNYDYVWIYYPSSDKFWGSVKSFAYLRDYQWTIPGVYANLLDALGPAQVGSEGAFISKLTNYYGNALYSVEKN